MIDYKQIFHTNEHTAHRNKKKSVHCPEVC